MKYRHELIIRVLEDGRMELSGPIDQPIIAFGLLELAKHVISEQMRAKTQRVQVVGAAEVPKDIKLHS